MSKIATIKQAIDISKKLKKVGKTIVLVGGCFDLIHFGHIQFLEKAKAQGGMLFVLLESDASIKRLKGVDRPIHNQIQRAHMLASLQMVDYVILLPPLESKEYDDIIGTLKPDILATTEGDPDRSHKERQAKKTHAQVIDVVKRNDEFSTSRIAKLLSKDL